MEFETVIGLEVHVQLSTRSKMFCGCSAEYASAPPNTHVCPICLGLPGVLPVINRDAVRKTVMTGLALGAEIPPFNKFDRKNYIYPDLMKGYQVSQYDLPMAVGGYLDIAVDGSTRRIGITRVHLEEDTARLTHTAGHAGDYSLVDVNRSGVPLMEIVTEPDLRSPQEARELLIELRRMLRYIDASTANMEEGQFRCDANISQRSVDGAIVGAKVEIKNMNSFRAVERALIFETERQRAALRAGETIVQETRGWSDADGVTLGQRSKEFAHDYRYFPEPDLPPLEISRELVAEITTAMPELPWTRVSRFEATYGLSHQESALLTDEAAVANYYERSVSAAGGHYRDVANWLVGDVFAIARARGGFDLVRITPEQLADIVTMVRSGDINAQAGKEVLGVVDETGQSPKDVVDQRGLRQVSDVDLVANAVAEIIAANPSAVEDYRSGKQAALGFLIGQVMKAMRGTGNPAVVRQEISRRLNEDAQ
ncbi:MAG: Asp-tRNA(Asn)/Glu-tRNA(Gln) amidotransferase subunit GatB [Thermomicrobiales bacterium]